MMAQRAEEEPRKTEVSKILLRAGLIATSVHQEDLAIRVYRQLLEKVPDHTVALRHLARIHHRRRDQAEAEELFRELLNSFKGKNPKEPEASERAADYTAWARILLRQGRGNEAEELLEEALRLNPNLIQGLRVAGPLYLDRGEPAKAGEMFDRTMLLAALHAAGSGRTTARGFDGDILEGYRRGTARCLETAAGRGDSMPFRAGSVLAMLIAPGLLLDPLDPVTRDRLAELLARYVAGPAKDNNTLLFRMMPAPLLERLGRSYDRARLDDSFDAILGMYRGDGWFIERLAP